MQIKTLLLAATAGSCVLATPFLDFLKDGSGRLQGYPFGWGSCLSDAQAAWIIQNFKSILTNPDRNAAAQTANKLLDNSYVETSDSINVLAGDPVSYSSKTMANTLLT